MAMLYWTLFWVAGLWALVVIPLWIGRFIQGNRLILPFLLSVTLAALAVKFMILPFMDGIFGFRSPEQMQVIAVKFWIGVPLLLLSIVSVFFEDFRRWYQAKSAERNPD